MAGLKANFLWRTNKVFIRCYSVSANSEDYQFLQRSKLYTYHFQQSLPRLAVPNLHDTCRRYLAAQEPLLNPEEYTKTVQLTKEFENGVGQKFHQELMDRDSRDKDTSYISEPWFDMYLRDRQSILLNYNPFMAFVDDPKPEYNRQDIRATNFLISALRFMKSLRSELLEPEVYHMDPSKSNTDRYKRIMKFQPYFIATYVSYLFKAYPLDMSQFPSLFNSTRIPSTGKDLLFKDESAKHILIMRNGHFFVFDALDKDGYILPPNEIYSCIKYITSLDLPSSQHPIGVLTSENRDRWATLREKLLSLGNEEQIRLIDSAFFNLILDDDKMEDDPVKIVRSFLHGDGDNRWFDKSFSLILSKEGKAAINFEHSWGDGVAVMRFFNEIYKDSTENPKVHPHEEAVANIDPSKHVKRLDLNIDDEIKHAITLAQKKFDDATGALGVNILESDVFGKNFCKKNRVSPDAMMQLGFQVAFHRQYGKTVATYESCSTSAFFKGRTETIRPATKYTKEFSKTINGGKGNSADLIQLLKDCSAYHGQLTKEAAMGQGFDRHLFAMKYYCQSDVRQELPGIFTDPAYSKINHNILSTSTLSSPAVLIGGFAPVVRDGFGIGYGITNNDLGAVVTSYPPNRDGAGFVEALKAAYNDIYNVIKSGSAK
ncbi:carnitine O-palmitoyltransferase 2, mitochondrial-like [Artemia franciscana]|uniref:Choline/carnitine acyltransferase domain-containing protein n=1 Tax=Artemia franciscana TaxID=6661 RepID=A0AA88HJ81_ARTSF|nr:hypothetical protein QYM36_016415 [Artemia franciscana]